MKADPNVSPPRTPVRVGFGTSLSHKALKRTSPTTSRPQPPSCPPPAQPEMPGKISQGEGQSDPCLSMERTKGGQHRGQSEQLLLSHSACPTQPSKAESQEKSSDISVRADLYASPSKAPVRVGTDNPPAVYFKRSIIGSELL